MADFSKYFPKLIASEGGYVNDPNDSGGETYEGISRANFPSWQGWEIIDTWKDHDNFPECLANDVNLNGLVKAFYKDTFWNRWLADQIMNQSLAELVVDWEVNSGTEGIKLVQVALHVTADGLVGPATIAAINNSRQDILFQDIWAAHEKFYKYLVAKNPKDQEYLKGWENRLAKQIFIA